MKTQHRCNLFVVGNVGVGKTSIIYRLTNVDYPSLETTTVFRNIDWTIKTDNIQIEVEIKESQRLDKGIFDRIKKSREQKSYILYVININERNRFNPIDKISLDALKELSSHATIIIAYTFFELKPSQNIELFSLRKVLPFVEYYFNIPLFPREYEKPYAFTYILKQIIVNANSNQLDHARELIKENFLTKAKTLDIGHCGLTSLMEIQDLFKNTHLESLILSNEWGENIDGTWIRKVSRNIGLPNVLFSIPKEISKLNKLEVLICGGNWKDKRKKNSLITGWHIHDISMLSSLPNLSILNVSNNEIEKIGPINKLENLSQIYLNNNRIGKFPKIDRLTRLKELYLSNNKLSSIDFLETLSDIKTIDLHSNRIKDLFAIRNLISKLNIIDSKWEIKGISISNNPLTVPPIEVVAKGKKSVLAYFKRLEAEKRIELNPYKNSDVKLILVGNSNVGKSTLVHWLKSGEVNKEIATTHWLKFDQWIARQDNSTFNVRVFDFGGQEYYHDTHHLFFTNRTTYVILWEAISNCFDEIEVEQKQDNGKIKKVKIETFPLEYWLDSIKYHTQKRKQSQIEKSIEKLLDERDVPIAESALPVENLPKHLFVSTDRVQNAFDEEENILVIQNKVDIRKYKKFIDEESIKNNHPEIFDFSSMSVYNKNGLELFKELLFEIFNSMEIINGEYLGTWGYIKQKIETSKFSKYLTLGEFKEYCNEIIIRMPELAGKNRNQIQNILFKDQDAGVFASFLSDIGICLYYPETTSLKDKVFLNQLQVLDNIHKILLDLKGSNGECDESMIIKALEKPNVDNEVLDIIQLMLHFKILFRHPDLTKKTYIAPLYLPKEPPQSVKLFHSLFHKPVYRYQYKTFIQKNVILDFFHLYGEKALKETNSDSLFYYWRDGIIIRDDSYNEIVMVKFISGNQNKRNAYLDIYVIKETEDEVFLKKIIGDIDEINQGILVKKLVSADSENYIPIETIYQNEKDNNWIFHYENKYYNLTHFRKYLKKTIKMKKIFISYSKQDHRFVTKFIEHLSAMQRDGKVAHWYCSELEPGSVWNDKIQKHLDEADIICFMISPNFMKTDYIHEHEITKALEKKANHANFKIVPIILDFCRWSTSKNDLSKYTALPYTAKPVADFDNQNMAWYIIEECLRLMIDNELNPTGEDFYKTQNLPSDIIKIYSRIVEGKIDKNTA